MAGLKILQFILEVNPVDSGTPSLTLQSRPKRDSFSDSLSVMLKQCKIDFVIAGYYRLRGN